MANPQQRESFVLGLTFGGLISMLVVTAFGVVLAVGGDSHAEGPTDAGAAEAGPQADQPATDPTTTTAAATPGGGPPAGRGPGSARQVEVTSNPTSAGVADPVVIDAFAAGGCEACHSIKGVGGGGANIGPPLFRTGAIAADRRPGSSAEAYIEQSILDPDAFIMPNCPTGPCPSGVMPQTFEQALSTDQIATIVEYLSALGTDAESDFITAP